MIKIKEYTVMKAGSASNVIAIPKVWMTDNKVKLHDRLNVYRDTMEGRDVLIIAKHK